MQPPLATGHRLPKGGRIRCHRCGELLSGRPVYASESDKGWACAERAVCAWRRRRALEARQLAFDWKDYDDADARNLSG